MPKYSIDELISQVEELQNRIGLLEDVHAIRRLQHAYGYYIDKCLYDETVDLFAENGEVHFMGGIFRGRAGVRRLYCDRFRKNFTGGKNGPIYGFLLDHSQLQDVIDVASDRKTARARFRCTMQAGLHESVGGRTRQWFEGGLYENSYVRGDGVWKIQVLNYRPVWHGDYETGWAHTRPQYVQFFSQTYPSDPVVRMRSKTRNPCFGPTPTCCHFITRTRSPAAGGNSSAAVPIRSVREIIPYIR